MSMFGTTACSVKGRCETLLRLRRPSAVADVIGMGLPTAVSTKAIGCVYSIRIPVEGKCGECLCPEWGGT